MQSLVSALKTKEGIIALVSIISGILVSGFGGYLTKDNDVLCNFVVITASIISMIGLDKLIHLIITFRDKT